MWHATRYPIDHSLVRFDSFRKLECPRITRHETCASVSERVEDFQARVFGYFRRILTCSELVVIPDGSERKWAEVAEAEGPEQRESGVTLQNDRRV